MSHPRTDAINEPSRTSRSRKRQDKAPEKPRLGSSSSPDDSGEVCVINMTAIERDLMISLAAYYRAERRNFEPGHELEDWLAAESQIDSLLIGPVDGERSPV